MQYAYLQLLFNSAKTHCFFLADFFFYSSNQIQIHNVVVCSENKTQIHDVELCFESRIQIHNLLFGCCWDKRMVILLLKSCFLPIIPKNLVGGSYHYGYNYFYIPYQKIYPKYELQIPKSCLTLCLIKR